MRDTVTLIEEQYLCSVAHAHDNELAHIKFTNLASRFTCELAGIALTWARSLSPIQ